MPDDLENKLEELLRKIDVDEEAERLKKKVVELESELAVYRRKEEPSMEQLLDKFKTVLNGNPNNFLGEIKIVDEILPPEEINIFLQQTVNFDRYQHYQNAVGFFTSKLIQNSYNAGNNEFTINTQSYYLRAINFLGFILEGKNKDNLMKLTIEGDVNDHCLREARNVSVQIKGNANKFLGFGTIDSIIVVNYNAGESCGQKSQNSTFNVGGSVGNTCGTYSKYSNFKVGGSVGDDCGGELQNSTFRIRGNNPIIRLARNRVVRYFSVAALLTSAFFIGKECSAQSENATPGTYEFNYGEN